MTEPCRLGGSAAPMSDVEAGMCPACLIVIGLLGKSRYTSAFAVGCGRLTVVWNGVLVDWLLTDVHAVGRGDCRQIRAGLPIEGANGLASLRGDRSSVDEAARV